jgi:pimeloyl-ACP methyl ester carboxylesterase
MSTVPSTPPTQHLLRSDVRAGVQLAMRATTGVIDIVEDVHQAVLRTLGASAAGPGARAGGLTGLVYRSIRGVAGLVDRGVQGAVGVLEPLIPLATTATESSVRAAVVAALNGVLGDQLEAQGNPLASAMTLSLAGRPARLDTLPDTAKSGGKLLLLIHGLCMHERHWDSLPGERGHAAALAAEAGYLPLVLRYNSGRAIARNGAELAVLLEQLVQGWPVPVTELTVVAHSMGGLLIRSAVAQANPSCQWRQKLNKIVFLGTPHHGAPLERIGNAVDMLLGRTSWSAPLARLGQLRSAGITDLRHGHVIDAYATEAERFSVRHDQRQPVPLPDGVGCYTVAATLASRREGLAARLLGDGLVPLESGLGEHSDAQHMLDFPAEAKRVLHNTGHLQLLRAPQVTEQLLDWLR